mgnify:FL=1
MPTHDTALDHVRVEVAFSDDPNTAAPAFVDLTSRALLGSGIEITRGRSEASGEVQTGSCGLTFDNTDGALSPGLASSPYYPNVKPQNRIRVTYRDPAVAGNLLSAEDASFEGGTTGTWTRSASGVTLANSSAQAWTGTKSLSVAWSSSLKAAWIPYAGLVIGRTYTWSAYVYVGGVTGSSVGIGAVGIGTSAVRTSWNNTWGRLSYTFTASNSAHFLEVSIIGATTRTDYVDGAMLDEGSTLAAFTTTPAPIVHRFDGYVDEWPIEWPSGGDNDSRSAVRVFDLQSRLSRARTLDSVITETYRLDSPGWHFPLDESSESASAGDRSGSGSTLEARQVNTGGELTFASGTGPGTDGASAPTFAPVDRYNGLYLLGIAPEVDPLGRHRTLSAVALTSTLQHQCIVEWCDAYGVGIILGTNSSGNAVAKWTNPWDTSKNVTVTSASIYADGQTHTFAATLSNDGAGTSTLRLYVDGVERGTAATFTTAAIGYILPQLKRISVGGTAFGDMFTGTISHVAGYGSVLTTLADHHAAASTGFAGDRSDERIERIASWIDFPAALMNLDVGDTTIGHVDSTGKSPWSYMQDVADTEAGVLFIDTTGVLTLHNRTRGYDSAAAVDVSVSAEVIDPDVRLASGIAGVVNDITVSRSGGASVRVVDAASVSTYGVLGESISIIGDSDLDVLNRANWELAMRSTPVVKLPELTLDGLTEPGTAAAVRGLDIGSRVQITGMPSQAPSSAADLRVQGYTERIGAGGWTLTANTTPFLPIAPLILDDDPRGRTDSTNRIAY